MSEPSTANDVGARLELGRSAERVHVADADRQELRLALVMNGGVSLAVWMGGVTNELDRARCDGRLGRPSGLYGQLLELFATDLVIDVVAGTSAGGLNGALLAAAIANGRPAVGIRDTWLGLGAFDKLLRSGFDADPPSVLRGDDYFLPSLEGVFDALCDPDAVRGRAAQETETLPSGVRLVITGTDIVGQGVRHVDSFNNSLADAEHRAHFLFTHDPAAPSDGVFANANIAAMLARAARTTASFPGAFEPSLNTVGGSPGGATDMVAVASFDTSRWLMDGGVLDNSPFSSVLDIVMGLPADRQVRRVITYIVPYSSQPPPKPDIGTMPPLGSVVSATLNLPRDVSLTNDLIRIEEYRRSRRARIGIRDTLLGFRETELYALAKQMFAVYGAQRLSVSVDEVLDRIFPMQAGSAVDPAQRYTNRLYVRQHTITADVVAAGGGENVRRGDDDGRAPAVAHRRATPALIQATRIEVPWVPAGTRALDAPESGSWAWGLTSADRAIRLLIEIARRVLLYSGPTGDADYELARKDVRDLRKALFGELDRLAALLRAYLTTNRDEVRNMDENDALAHAVKTYSDAVGDQPRDSLRRAVDAMLQARAALAHVLGQDPGEVLADRRREWRVLDVALKLLDRDAAGVIRVLLCIEVIERATGGEWDPDVAFELLRIDGESATTLRGPPGGSRPADCQLAGTQIAHFGGFYKRSWRANDWLWGRLEGAARLVDLIVDPARLRILYGQEVGAPDGWIDRLADDVLHACDHPRDATLAAVVLDTAGDHPRRAVIDELTAVVAGTEGALDLTRRLLTRAIQIEILIEELPVVARQVAVDVEHGTSPHALGVDWRASLPEKAPGVPLTAREAVDAFRRMEIGKERIGAEIGADALTELVATTAAVTTNAVSSRRSGLPWPLRAPVSAARGVALALYALVRGVTLRQPGLSALLVLLLAIAGVLVGFAVYGQNGGSQGVTGSASQPPGWLVAIATVVIVAGMVAATLRSGWWGVLLVAGIVASYVALLFTPWPHGPKGIYDRLRDRYPAETLVVVFVILCSLVSVVQRWGWRAYTKTGIPQRQARKAMRGVMRDSSQGWDQRPE